MSLLSSYKANKAISTILAEQVSSNLDSKQARLKLKKIGPVAIPNLIESLGNSNKDDKIIEMLLQGFVNEDTLLTFIYALNSADDRVKKSLIRVLSLSNDYNPNRLLELFDQPGIASNALSEILMHHAKKVNANPVISKLDKVSSSSRPYLYRLLEQVITDKAIPSLIHKTQSNDPMVRAYLATLLKKFDTAEVHATLNTMLSDPNKNVRQAALQSLSSLISMDSVQAICHALHDTDITVQTTAIDALIHINASNTVKFLIDVLQDESEYVRRAAVEVLNEIGNQNAIKDLLNALRDADWWVKVRAADALGSIGGPKVSEAVLTLITDEDEFMRRTAVEILNTSKDPQAFNRLIDALKDKDWWVRERAVDALAAIGDKRAVQPLIKMLKHSPKSSQVIIRALGTLGDKDAIKPIISQLKADDVNARKEALSALQQLTDSEHVDEVQNAISQLIESPFDDGNMDAIEAMKTLVARYGTEATSASSSPTVSSPPSNLDIDISDSRPTIPNEQNTLESNANIEIVDASRLIPGDLFFDRYKIIRQVGKGAFGIVVLVEDIIVNDQFILKFLNHHVAMDSNIIQRFTHELRYARKITHENIIRIYDFITYKNSYAISMEYFPSHSLAAELKNKKPIDLNHGLNILIQICKGMQAAQSMHVVHRDIKPGNLLIGDKNIVKIVDFGLAAAASKTDSRLTKTGILVGTPTYMAPEQVRGQTIDSRTDIYALGIIMYEMFTGIAPYVSDETLSIMFQHVEGNAKPVRELNPDIPLTLQLIIAKAMSKIPGKRFQTFEELGHELRMIQKDLQ